MFAFVRALKREHNVTLLKLRNMFEDYRMAIKVHEIDLYFHEFDLRRGVVPAQKLIDSFKIKLSSEATHGLNKIYTNVPRTMSRITAFSFRRMFHPENHPDVLGGARTSEEVLSEMLSTFDCDGEISFADMENYFELLQATNNVEKVLECWVSTEPQIQQIQPSIPIPFKLHKILKPMRPLQDLRRDLQQINQKFISKQQLSKALEKYYGSRIEEQLIPLESESGIFSIDEVMQTLWPIKPNASRIRIVDQAFSKLDPNNQGVVHVEILQRKYRNIKNIDLNISGYFNQHVVREDFHKFYGDIGSLIEDDNFFLLLVWNEWELSKK